MKLDPDKISVNEALDKHHVLFPKGEDPEKTQIEKDLANAKQENSALNKQLSSAFRSMDRLIKHITELENSRLMKLRKYLRLYFSRLRSNFSKGQKRNFFSTLINYVFKRGWPIFRALLIKIFKGLYLFFETRKVVIIEVGDHYLATTPNYSQYILRKRLSPDMVRHYKKMSKDFKYQPLLSIVIPVYNPRIDLLRKALDSVLAQIYENWELCLADDCSTDTDVWEALDQYSKKDSRIKVVYRETNGHISIASNSALRLASGEYSVLMDHDDLLREDALFEIARLLNEKPDLELIYTDEDKIDDLGIHSEPHFKPDWCPQNLLSRNYLGHLCVFDTEKLRSIGGWRAGFEGSQDYDLILRFSEKYSKVAHIPEVLYHWRVHSQSAAFSETVKPYAYRAAQVAITEFLTRKGHEATVDFLDGFRGYKVRFKILKPEKKLSIIIPARNKKDYLETCLNSIRKVTTFKNFEIILIDNNSDQQEFFDFIEAFGKLVAFPIICVRDEGEFNFSRLINLGRKHATGDYLLLLNNDTEIITPDWIEAMMEHSQRAEIGVVGCKLLYANDTIQHAGVIVGMGGAAGHVLVGEYRDGPGYFNYVNMLNTYSALTAACFMVRTELFDEVGGFDESFTVEYNDVDFCLKVKETGRHNLYVPHVEVYHFESMTRGHPFSTPESYNKHVKEVNMFCKKWKKYVENDPCYNSNLSLGVNNFGMK